MRKYVLWTLKLLGDCPAIFERTDFLDIKELEQKKALVSKYDVIISDRSPLPDISLFNENAIIAYLNSKSVSLSQYLIHTHYKSQL